ncbi:MAG: putative rane protein, partial [Gaiellaceae bacterium]|nr:putative rane protein [Gaiellaceae bacterium]
HPRHPRTTATTRAPSELSRALRAAALAAPVYLLAATIPPGGLFRERRFRDVGLYGDYAQALLDGRVPYRHYFVEYPPGGFLVFTPPALLPDGWYLHAFKSFMALVGLATLAVVGLILARLGASPRRLYAGVFAVALSPLVIGPVSLNTYDAFPALLVAGSLAALLWRRDSVALALLGVAFAAKLYAAALVPLFALWLWRTGRPLARPLAAFAVAALVLVGPFALLGWDGLVESVRAQTGRGLQIESLGAAFLLAAHRLGVYDAEVLRGSTAALTRDLDGALPDALAFATSPARAGSG